MKRLLMMIATLLCFGLVISDVNAASRMGGGKSSGVQRNNVMQKQAAPPATPPASQAAAAKPAPATPAAPAPSGMSRWLGPLAGLALGAGLASMFMGGGLGGGIGSILMIALLAGAAFMLFRMLRRPQSDSSPMQLAGAGESAGNIAPTPVAGGFSPIGSQLETPASATAPGVAGNVPAGFDVEAFLRQAKLNFMRLQAANDRKDMQDIRNFTTPEMFAEISLQAQERRAAEQQIDVMELKAELLDVTEGPEEHLASVRFFGTLRESPTSAPESFNEAWHLAKSANGKSGWLIAGIQQFA